MYKVNESLTIRGLRLLQQFGNGDPTYSQVELAQKLVGLISDGDSDRNKELADLCFNDTISRESLQNDSKFMHFQAKSFQLYTEKLSST